MSSIYILLEILAEYREINYMRLKQILRDLWLSGKVDFSFNGYHSEELEEILKFLQSYNIVRFDGGKIVLTDFGYDFFKTLGDPREPGEQSDQGD